MSPPIHQEQIERVLAQSEWLRALALSLVGDVHEAEDIAQQTVMRALERPPREPRVRGWLATVARRIAQRQRLRAQHRVGREQTVARTEATSSSAELVERVTLQRQVAAAVLALEEPYRTAVLRRYLEELSPAEIARREALPEATVRTHVHRGLKRLRERMAGEFGADSWRAALLPLLGGFRAFEKSAPAAGGAALAGGLLAVNAKICIGIVLSVALLVGLAWVVGSDDGIGPATGTGDGAALRGRDELATAEESGPESIASRSRVSADPRSPEEEAPKVAADRGSLRIVVIDAITRMPLPGVEIGCYDPFLQTELSYAHNCWKGSQLDWILERGRRYTSDEEGVVHLSRSPSELLVAARSGARLGMSSIAPTVDGPHELILEATSVVRVQVVDAQGQPVPGVPVQLWRGRKDAEGRRWNLRDLTRALTSSADGIANLQYAPGWLEREARPDDELYASVDLPLLPKEDLLVDPHSSGQEPLRIELPPTGAVRVEVRDSLGHIVRSGARLYMQWSERDVEDAVATGIPLLMEKEPGIFELPVVGLGLHFEYAAGLIDQSVENLSEEGDGPIQPGEVVSLIATLGKPWPRISGRLVNEEGTPLREKRVLWKLVARWKNSESTNESSLVTDLAGHFSLHLTPQREEGRLAYYLTFLAWNHTDGWGFPRGARAVVDVATGLGSGVTELGDIVLCEEDLLVAGVVRDEVGQPLSGLEVEALPVRIRGGGEFEEDDVWFRRVIARTGAGGRFELRGPSDYAELAVRANDDAYVPSDRQIVAPGTRDLALVLQRCGSISGRWLIEPEFRERGVNLRFVLPDGRSFWENRYRYPRDTPRSSFHLQRLMPGLVTLEFHTWPAGLLERVQNVAVPAGGTAQDPRLDPVDLRGRLQRVVYRFVDEGGRPIESISVAEAPASGPPGWSFDHRGTDDGRYTLIVPRELSRFSFSAEGREAVTVEWTGREETVVLRKKPR